MEVAPLYKLLVHCLHRFLRSLIILFILFKLLSTASTLECMPIVREGWNAIGMHWSGLMSKMLESVTVWMDGWLDE